MYVYVWTWWWSVLMSLSSQWHCAIWLCKMSTSRKLGKVYLGLLGTSLYYFLQLHVTQQWSQNKRIKINRSLTSYFISARLVGKERWCEHRGNTNRDVNRMVIPRCRLNKTISVWNWKNGGPRKVNFSIESLSEITLPWLFLSSQSEIVKIKRVSIIVLLNFLVFKSLALLKYNWLAILKNFLCCGSY